MIIGLAGTHCTGKSTLAQAVADRYGIPFIKTSTSQVFKELGKDPKVAMPLTERLQVQKVILYRLAEEWADVGKDQLHITDRTPYCMAAYTLAEVSGYETIHPFHDRELMNYLALCHEVATEFFGSIVHLPIALEFEENQEKIRASGSRAYREHHDLILRGLLSGKANVFGMPHIDLDLRVSMIGGIMGADKPS